jgi:hypothetical protein
MSLVNKYNMIVWDDDGIPNISCENEYTYPIVESDTISFYVNFFGTMPEDASGWHIGWWTPDMIFIENIATLSVDDIDGINSNLYGSVTVGVLPRSLLRLVIYDPDDYDDIKYWSSGFRFKTATANTSVLKYRNSQSILNFEFENVPTSYNQVRIDVRIGEPISTQDTEGYEVSTGHKVVSKSIHAATRMSHVYFDNIRYERPVGGQYTQETVSKEYKFWLGRIRLEQYDYTVVASNT